MKKYRTIHGHRVLIEDRADKDGNVKMKNHQTNQIEHCHSSNCEVREFNGKKVIINKKNPQVYRVTF